ncbi:MAG: hypothetical protein H7Z74_13090 [Anaerolineae bacterium]|nr:hypothetical protein [Gemmatimonadaceae bacterium]
MDKAKGRDRNRPAAGRGDSGNAARSSASERATGAGGSFWVTLQGHAVSVHSGSEAPSKQHAEGDRLIEVEGPYPSEEVAERRAALLRSRSPLYVGDTKELRK